MTPDEEIADLVQAIAEKQREIALARESLKDLEKLLAQIRQEKEQADRLAAREAAVERGRKWAEENPEEHAAFLEKLRRQNREGLIEGWLDGWWDIGDDFDRPMPNPLTFKISDFAQVKNPLMAHVMAKAGIFPSVGQARKNGWDKPLTVGDFTVTKHKIRIRVVE